MYVLLFFWLCYHTTSVGFENESCICFNYVGPQFWFNFFFLFVSILALVFLIVNLILAPHNPYQEKYSIFECGFHSFLGQNRTQFGVKFFIFALVYLLLDLEILLTFPFALSEYINDIYGLTVALMFIIIITIGFVFELGKSALKIDSRQVITLFNVKSSNITELISKNNDVS